MSSGYSQPGDPARLSISQSSVARGPTLKVLDSVDPSSFPIDATGYMRTVTGGDISSRYDVDWKVLAEGGNGKVFRGKDKQAKNRHVIIKKVCVSGVDDKKLRAFKREAAIMKQLDHPNICKLFELYEDSRFMFFVLEECEGGELFDRIQDNASEATTAEYVSQIAGALHHAHSKQIAHRDLKPENVCLSSNDPADRHLKVIDWGLGFFFGTAHMKSVVGSLAYAAPEVLTAEDTVVGHYSAACDLWSLGVVTYVLICGRPPFWGSITTQIKKMNKEEYPMRRDTKNPWPNVSEDCKSFIECLLKADPSKRLPIDQVTQHPWLRSNQAPIRADSFAVNEAMWNMKMASLNSKFLNVCVATAARQLDYKSVKELHEVFRKFDENQDGALDIDELRKCFSEHYGAESLEVRDIEKTFKSLDLDGSGTIDYTEFIVAVAGEKMLRQEDVLWTSFKTFDIDGDDDKITKAEIKKVLSGDGVRAAWGPDVCDAVAQEIFDRFDKENLGYITFDRWMSMMREGAWPDQSWDDDTRRHVSRHSVSTKNTLIAWVSLDPRNGCIQPYPLAVARMIEEAWQKKEPQIFLGAMFYEARVCFTGSPSGYPFQRTKNGLRDVRRVEVSKGEVVVNISGKAGEYRIDDRGKEQAQSPSTIMDCAINPAEVKHEIDEKKKQESSTFGISGLESTMSMLRRAVSGFGFQESPCDQSRSRRE